MKHRVSVIFGTRPEAIKLAPVILAFRRETAVECRVCVTAQHRQLLDSVLDVFGLIPHADLNVMLPDQRPSEVTSRMIDLLDAYLVRDRPDLVLVQGDTTSAFCAALAAFYNRVPVGHVEAGMRTHNLSAPWPEEANRVLISHLATLHFAATERSRQNLLREGVDPCCILVTGNTVIDALLIARANAGGVSVPGVSWPATTRTVVITAHRRESFGEEFRSLCRAIVDLARLFPNVQFVYPVHLNPSVRRPVFDILSGHVNIHLIDPLPYLGFVALMERAYLILTDSGGIQEEAPSLGKPVLVLRRLTERPEALEAGTARLVGTDCETIVRETAALLNDPRLYARMARAHNPYGDGHAAGRIVKACLRHLVQSPPPS